MHDKFDIRRTPVKPLWQSGIYICSLGDPSDPSLVTSFPPADRTRCMSRKNHGSLFGIVSLGPGCSTANHENGNGRKPSVMENKVGFLKILIPKLVYRCEYHSSVISS